MVAWPRSRRVGILAVVAVAMSAGACTDDGDDATPPEPLIDLGQSAIGQCLLFDETVDEQITELPTTECATDHSHEIFAVVSSVEPAYPGFEALEDFAQVSCLGEFERYIGISPFDSELFYSWIVPTLDSWENEKDREVLCLAGNFNGQPLDATVKGSER